MCCDIRLLIPLSAFGRWLGLVLCFEITLGAKHDTWGTCLAQGRWLSVVKTYTELVSISYSVPSHENKTSQRKIRRLSLPGPCRFFALLFTAQLPYYLGFYLFEPERTWTSLRWYFHFIFGTRLNASADLCAFCFICTEVALYDHDRLAVILGLKSQWTRTISWKEQTVSSLEAMENN